MPLARQKWRKSRRAAVRDTGAAPRASANQSECAAGPKLFARNDSPEEPTTEEILSCSGAMPAGRFTLLLAKDATSASTSF